MFVADAALCDLHQTSWQACANACSGLLGMKAATNGRKSARAERPFRVLPHSHGRPAPETRRLGVVAEESCPVATDAMVNAFVAQSASGGPVSYEEDRRVPLEVRVGEQKILK